MTNAIQYQDFEAVFNQEDKMGISENIRENIRKLINEAKGTISIPEPIEHMITEICFQMYKHGLKDGHTMSIKYINTALEALDK